MAGAGLPPPMLAGVNPLAAAQASSMLPPDPGPGQALCFDYINKGFCVRLQKGETCRFRHLPPTHPDVVADKIRQGKAPSTGPLPPMGGYVNTLAQMGAAVHNNSGGGGGGRGEWPRIAIDGGGGGATTCTNSRRRRRKRSSAVKASRRLLLLLPFPL